MDLEVDLDSLETQVKKYDTFLQDMSQKLDLCEKEVLEVTCDEHKEIILHLLDAIAKLKNTYKALRKNVAEVQELQKEIHDAVHDCAAQVQTRYQALRAKLINHQ